MVAQNERTVEEHAVRLAKQFGGSPEHWTETAKAVVAGDAAKIVKGFATSLKASQSSPEAPQKPAEAPAERTVAEQATGLSPQALDVLGKVASAELGRDVSPEDDLFILAPPEATKDVQGFREYVRSLPEWDVSPRAQEEARRMAEQLSSLTDYGGS